MDPHTRHFLIINSRGLHARASAKFVKCAESFDAQVTVSRDGQSVPGTSIIVSVQGPQAEEAMSALAQLVADRFGEE